jgi:hypothetical protein
LTGLRLGVAICLIAEKIRYDWAVSSTLTFIASSPANVDAMSEKNRIDHYPARSSEIRFRVP